MALLAGVSEMTPEKKQIVIVLLQSLKGVHKLLDTLEKMLQELIK